MFRLEGSNVVNEKGKVLDVQNRDDVEGRHIFIEKKNDQYLSQQWDIIYDADFGLPGKGELNTEIGLYVERDFYVVSQLPDNRYLDLLSNRHVIKVRNGRNTQTWYFHQDSMTIRSRSNNQSWNIVSNGGSKDM